MRGTSLEGTLAAVFVHGQTLLLFIIKPSTKYAKAKLRTWLLHFSSRGLSSCFFLPDSHQQQRQLNVDLDLLHLFASHTARKKREDLESR